ncbi:hypothetical protein ECH7EC4113_0016, partial [Escherichia coli O157:H7 str. EC4113]
ISITPAIIKLRNSKSLIKVNGHHEISSPAGCGTI